MGRLKGSKNINSRLEYLVLLIKAQNPGWSAERVGQYLARANKNLPILKKRTIQKILAEGKTSLEFLNKDFEKPWHLGLATETEYEISPEAIAAIFEVQKWLEEAKDNPNIATTGIKEWTENFTNGKMTTNIWPLTIREAGWISRLYKVNYPLTEPEKLYLAIHKQPIVDYRPLVENTSRLWYAAKTYADYQRLCEIAKVDFDTSRLDEAIRKGNIGRTKYDLFFEYKSKKDGEK